jgi:hypothetical protein
MPTQRRLIQAFAQRELPSLDKRVRRARARLALAKECDADAADRLKTGIREAASLELSIREAVRQEQARIDEIWAKFEAGRLGRCGLALALEREENEWQPSELKRIRSGGASVAGFLAEALADREWRSRRPALVRPDLAPAHAPRPTETAPTGRIPAWAKFFAFLFPKGRREDRLGDLAEWYPMACREFHPLAARLLLVYHVASWFWPWVLRLVGRVAALGLLAWNLRRLLR